MHDSQQALLETLKRAAAALKNAGIGFAVAGGAAAYARGAGPPQKDVDLMLAEADVERAVDALVAAGMRRVEPPEDWLAKVYDDDRLVDLIHRPAERPVTPELLDRAEQLTVDGLVVPVLDATDLMVFRLLSLSEHYCDLSSVLAVARAVREQVDWPRVRAETEHWPFAYATLVLLDRLSVVPTAEVSGERGAR